MTKKRSVLSLYSGCGGLDLGFIQAGFHLVAAYDHWGPAVEAHQLNMGLLGEPKVFQKSLCISDGEVKLDELPEAEVVLGGPPCQGFSFAGKQFKNDPRNKLYRDFVEIVRHLQPRCFVMENVRGMEAMALDQVTEDFEEAGYRVLVSLARAVNFGLAQKRERLIIVGLRRDLEEVFQPPDSVMGGLFSGHQTSLIEAIGDLPQPIEVVDDEASLESLPQHLRSHAFRPLSAMVQKFLRHVPNGGCFRDAPRKFLPERLKKILDEPARYRSPRLFPKPNPEEPAQTIPADTNPSLGGVLAPDLEYRGGRAGGVDVKRHTKAGVYTSPSPSRRLTPREAARLQGFPDTFQFVGSLGTQFKLIGNAVPVPLARAFAESLFEQLSRIDKKRQPPPVAKACRKTR